MKKTQWKDTFREIRKTMVSWIAIVTVTMIGCGVYFGVYFYADSLSEQGERFLSATCFEDFTVLAPAGLSDADIQRLKSVDGIVEAEGGYILSDVFIHFGDTSESMAVHTLTELVSKPVVSEGILPKAENECALPSDWMQRHALHIGDTIRLDTGDTLLPPGFMKNELFTITASLTHPECICTEYEDCVFIPKTALNTSLVMNRYTCVRLDAALPEGMKELSDDCDTFLLPLRRDLEKTLDDIGGKNAAFGLLMRNAKEGFLTYRTDVRTIHRLALIFVTLFLVIGAVVVASTITILIDNSKKRLGMMIAYGFRTWEIASRFLVYGNSAIFLGLGFGIALAAGLQKIIHFVIGGLFTVQADAFAFYPANFLILAALEFLMATLVAVTVTCLRITRLSAVDLMNGTLPARIRQQTAHGSESIPLYSRLILRNMHMDNARIMTSIAIIGGSCLLMGLGLTLKDSLDDTMPRSAQQINHYDLQISAGQDPETALTESVDHFLADKGVESLWIHSVPTIYQYQDISEYATVISGPGQLYPGYIDLKDEKGRPLYPLDGNALIPDFRMSEKLGMHPGDSLVINDSRFRKYTGNVTGICRNYYPRLIYMGEEIFREVFGEASSRNTVLVRLSGQDRDAFVQDLAAQFPDLEVTFTDTLPRAFDPMSKMFHVVVYILTALSIFMALFVLLNLVNIFVERRKNELIVMAVNGFSDRQQVNYLLRETLVTTFSGLALGVLLGWAMTSPVVRTVEVGEMMFVRDMNIRAWLIASGIEALFSLTIHLSAFRRIRSFDLTELTR